MEQSVGILLFSLTNMYFEFFFRKKRCAMVECFSCVCREFSVLDMYGRATCCQSDALWSCLLCRLHFALAGHEKKL